MVEIKLRHKTVDLPYTIRLHGVTEEMFDELVDEDTKAELLDGVMIVHSPASPRHDDVAGFVRGLMRCYARRKRLGRVLGPDTVVHLATCRKFAPDGLFLKQARVQRSLSAKQFEGAPDLVVEILAPSNRNDDLNDKRPAYRKAGVREIWLIDPDTQEAVIDRKGKRGYASTQVSEGRLASAVLPGFWLDLAWVWAEELPDDLDCLQQILQGPPST